MNRKETRSHTSWKRAALAAAMVLSLVSIAPNAGAAGTLDEFSKAVSDEMNSNSQYMQEARQYVAAARTAQAAGEDLGTFSENYQESLGENSELVRNETSFDDMKTALERGYDDQSVLTTGVMRKVGNEEQFADNTAIRRGLSDINTERHYSFANGRVIPGTSYILGNQSVNGTLKVGEGLDVNEHKITSVQDGEVSPVSHDAVNGSQLYRVNRRIDRVDNKVNRVGAGAAALAALKPLPYSPDQKWSIAAGYGHYHDVNASAFGAYYYPNENFMVSVGSVVGNGENMFNAGVSLRLGPSGDKARVKTGAASSDVEALKAIVEEQRKQIQEQGSQIQTQSDQIQKQGAQILEQGHQIEALEKRNAELLEKLEQLQS